MPGERRKRQIGLSFVIGFGPSSTSEMIRAAELAEKNGFDSVFVPEHYYDRECPSILGAISQLTYKIRIGTGVINPYTRYPSLIAMTAATLDELSNGRTFLGLGTGGIIGSLAHGIPNEFAGQRFEHPLGHLREMVEILRKLLGGESVNFNSQFYSLANVRLNFAPVQHRIPIYFGQQGPNMMKLAGEVADGVLITLCCTVPYVKEVIRIVDGSARSSKRSPRAVDYGARIVTVISDENPRKAVRQAKQLVGRVFIHPGAKPVLDASGFELDIDSLKKAVDSGRSDKLDDLVSDEIAEMSTASGTKREVLNRIEEYRKAGVTHALIVPVTKDYREVIQALAP